LELLGGIEENSYTSTRVTGVWVEILTKLVLKNQTGGLLFDGDIQ